MKNLNESNGRFKIILPKILFGVMAIVFTIVTMLFSVACTENPSNPDNGNGNTNTVTNESLIEECVETFLTAYNDGDMDEVLQCLTAKSRNAMQAMLNLLGAIAGSYAEFEIDLKDLFSLGISTVDGEFMMLEITQVEILNSTEAIATTSMSLPGGMDNEKIYFEMVYEKGGWYINDITDTASSDSNNSSAQKPDGGGSSGTTDSNGSSTQIPDGGGSSNITSYYVTTYSNTSKYGTAGTYTEYSKTDFAVGSTVLLEATVNDGFNFEGWYLSEGWSSVCLSTELTYQYEMKAFNASIEARYSYYTVNVGVDGDDYGMAGTSTKYADKKVSVGNTVVLEATVNSGYNFEGWYASRSDVCLSSNLRYEFEMKAENVNITARYTYYTVSVEGSNDEYGVAGSFSKKNAEKVSVGEAVTLTATVNKGYNFEGWYASWSDVCLCKDLTYSFEMEAENVNIEARYSYYTVTVGGVNDEYGVAGSFSKKNAEKVSVGDTVTLTATVNEGYNFEGWYVNWSDVCISKDLSYSFTMKAENIYIEAKYSYYTISVYEYEIGGWFDNFRDVVKVSVGNEVTLTATSYSGYRFEGWHINGVYVSKDSTYQFVMPPNDVYLNAVYSKIEN